MARDWESRLQLIMHRIREIPEPSCDCYEAYPPARQPWPEGLPPSPALSAFYELSDGGRFSRVNVGSISEIMDETKRIEEWMASLGEDEDGNESEGRPRPGQRWVFGFGEFGHAMFWDVPRDRVLFYDTDGGGWWDSPEDYPLGGLAMSKFWETLFFPDPEDDDEGVKLWDETMEMLEKLPERGRPGPSRAPRKRPEG